MAKRMGSLPFVAIIASFACALPAEAQTVREPQDGLVTVLCRSLNSLCHLGLKCQRANAAQI